MNSQVGGSVSSSKKNKWYWWLPVIIVAVIYAFTVWRYTINFPFWDDYYALLDFIDVQITEPSIAKRIASLYEQHYEHRLVTGRLIAWAGYALAGVVNFRMLVFVANVFYIIWFFWLAHIAIKRRETAGYGLFIIAAFVFSIHQWDVSSWATTALFFYTIYLLAFAAIVAYFSAAKYGMLLAWLAGLLATFSGAHGLVIFPAIALADLLIRGWRTRRFITWAIGGILAVAMYSWGYIRPEHQPPLFGAFWQDPVMAIRYFLVLTGNVFNAGKNIALGWGLFLCVLCCWILYQKAWKKSPQLFAMWLFLLLTMLAITAGRSSAGAGQAFTLRYITCSSAYSGLLLVLCLSVCPSKFKRICGFLFIFLSFCGFAWSYINMMPQIQRNYEDHDINMERIEKQQLSLFNYGSEFDNDDLSKAWLKRYDSLGIFPFKFTDEEIIFASIPTAIDTNWKMSKVINQDHGHFYKIVASVKNKNASDSIHFASLSLLKPNGEIGWWAMMRPSEIKMPKGVKQFEVIVMKIAWPVTPENVRFEITDEKKKMVLPYQFTKGN